MTTISNLAAVQSLSQVNSGSTSGDAWITFFLQATTVYDEANTVVQSYEPAGANASDPNANALENLFLNISSMAAFAQIYSGSPTRTSLSQIKALEPQIEEDLTIAKNGLATTKDPGFAVAVEQCTSLLTDIATLAAAVSSK